MDEITPETELPEVVQELLEKRRDGAQEARQLVGNAELNLAFLTGNQWMRYTWSSGVSPVANPNEDHVTDNRMWNIYRRSMFYHFKEDPVIVAHEGGRELRDAESALVASSICDFWEKQVGWREARREAVGWMNICGIGYIMPAWVKTQGIRPSRERLEYVDRGYEDETGRTSYVKRSKAGGWGSEMKFISLCPLSTYLFPLTAKSWSEVEEVLNVELVSAAWIRDNVMKEHESIEDYQPVRSETVDLNVLDKIKKYVSGSFSYARSVNGSEKDRYLVMRWWQKPGREHRNGRRVFVAGNKIIKDGPLPCAKYARQVDPADAHNLTMGIIPLRSADLAGAVIPPAPMTGLRGAQVRLNELLTDQRTNRRTVGRNKLISPRGAFDSDAWTDEHGELIQLDKEVAQMPEFVQGMPLAGIENEIAGAEHSLEEVSGHTPVMRGKNDTQVRAAWQLSILRNEAMTLVNAEVLQHEQSYEKCARLALAIARDKYPPEKIVEIVGFEREGFALTFETASISYDIRIEVGSMQPRNHALREAKLSELASRGFFDEERGGPGIEAYWEMSELGSLNRNVTTDMRHRTRAKAEMVQILTHGRVIIPYRWEDHEIHIEQHIADLARNEWYRADDRTRVAALGHVEYHRQLLVHQNITTTPQSLEPSAATGVPASGGSSPQMPFPGSAAQQPAVNQ